MVVEVADTGPGIDPADLGHIWEELYRSPRVRAVAGSGLGLALVRAVGERHGGVVEVESRLGRGTVMRIQLPVRIDRPLARASAVLSDDRQKAADPAT